LGREILRDIAKARTGHDARLLIMNLLGTWVRLVSKGIWLCEVIFFYPKLFRYYNKIQLEYFENQAPTIFDVGANKGQSIKFFAQIFDNPKIYAFEPSPKTFGFLKKFVDHMDGTAISIFQIGIGDKEQVLNFYESILSETSTFALPDQNSEYQKRKNRVLFQNFESAFTSIPTRVTTIDTFLNENNMESIDVLKIDVEGFELEVIRGAQQALRDGRVKIVQFERHADDMREDTYPTIHKLLDSFGFVKSAEIKHPIGNFFEVLYLKPLNAYKQKLPKLGQALNQNLGDC
jgi:FkbM family methyltransferase